MKYIFLVVAILCAGCTTVKFNGAETKTKIIDNPAIGKTVTSYVGDQLVQKGMLVEEKVLQVNHPIDGFAYNIQAGSYPQIGYDDKNDYYSSSGVTRNPLADPQNALAVGKRKGSEICVVTIYGGTGCYQGSYERKTITSGRGTSFQQTLIYSGRVGNKINIGYREFSNDMARPAFNNDVEYDLSTSNIIGYKGAQLEVITADNSSITYKVIRNFP